MSVAGEAPSTSMDATPIIPQVSIPGPALAAQQFTLNIPSIAPPSPAKRPRADNQPDPRDEPALLYYIIKFPINSFKDLESDEIQQRAFKAVAVSCIKFPVEAIAGALRATHGGDVSVIEEAETRYLAFGSECKREEVQHLLELNGDYTVDTVPVNLEIFVGSWEQWNCHYVGRLNCLGAVHSSEDASNRRPSHGVKPLVVKGIRKTSSPAEIENEAKRIYAQLEPSAGTPWPVSA